MKLLVITSLYPSPTEPSKAPFNYQTIEALSRFCDVRVISARPWWTRVRCPSELFRAPATIYGGIPASYPAYWSIPGMTSIHGQMLYRALRSKARRIRSEFPFDAILATWAFPDIVAAARLASELGCPLFAKVHGSDINDFTEDPRLKPQIQQALAQAELVVA